MGLFFGTESINVRSKLDLGNSPCNYKFISQIEEVAFPRELPSESTDWMFDNQNDYIASNLPFSCYEPNSSIERISEFFDENPATNGNMINGLRFKFNEPVLMTKMYVRNSGGYQVTLKGTNNASIMNDVYSDLWDIIYTGSAEDFDVNLNPTQSYQYYCLTKNSGYKTIYELKFYAITGNVKCSLTSTNMTPTINCFPKDYMRLVTQPFYNGSETIDSQTLVMKSFEDDGCLYNYEDDGSAVNLKMYLLKPTGQAVESDFRQPILTENGTMGGSSFAVDSDSYYDSSRVAYKAFDGKTIMEDASYDQWHSGNYNNPHWISFYNPQALKITKITVFNGADNVLPLDWEFQYSDTNSSDDWHTLTSGTNTELTANGEWSFDVENSGYHQYYRLYILSATGRDAGYVGITEIKMEAKISEVKQYRYILSKDSVISLDGYESVTQVADLNIPAHIYFNGSDWVMGDERIEVHPIVKPEVLPDVVIPE